jgi:hypothetical protein
MNRQRQNRTLATPGRVKNDHTPRCLCAYILSSYSVNPSFAWLFDIATVITDELQHLNLESGS